MPTDANELRPRIGNRLRVKIHYPGNPTQPFTEQEAILVRVDEPNRFAYFCVGVVTLKVSWDDVEMISGGLLPTYDAGPSKGTAF